MSDRHCVVMFSGGIASWCAAERTIEAYGKSNVELLFTDCKNEDESTYKFVRDGAQALGVPLIWAEEGRSVWEVFRDVRMLGNTMFDPCSRILKRDFARKWMDENRPDSTIVMGLTWEEKHRHDRVRRHWEPYTVWFPMADEPWIFRDEMISRARSRGLRVPELYAQGFGHANCGGACIKQGIGGWLKLLQTNRELYLENEKREDAFRDWIQKDVSILRDRTDGENKRLTLRQLRERAEGGESLGQQALDFGGCGCFSD